MLFYSFLEISETSIRSFFFIEWKAPCCLVVFSPYPSLFRELRDKTWKTGSHVRILIYQTLDNSDRSKKGARWLARLCIASEPTIKLLGNVTDSNMREHTICSRTSFQSRKFKLRTLRTDFGMARENKVVNQDKNLFIDTFLIMLWVSKEKLDLSSVVKA